MTVLQAVRQPLITGMKEIRVKIPAGEIPEEEMSATEITETAEIPGITGMPTIMATTIPSETTATAVTTGRTGTTLIMVTRVPPGHTVAARLLPLTT